MRISDWSSDVCSSDLVVIKLECATEQRLELHTVRHGGIGREAFDAREHKGRLRGEVVARESVQRGLHGGQIGKGLGLGYSTRRVAPRPRRPAVSKPCCRRSVINAGHATSIVS